MQLDVLRTLSPEQALQAAATDLSLPNEFFDRMWAQESGRGQKMLSPKGARGHFQIMPETQKAWETRDGKSYNPDDFYEGLYLASQTMRENLTKFKDPVDATRAYNGGWNPKRWGNAETVGYVQALWGNTAPAKPGAPPADASPEDWPRLPALPKGKGAPAHDEADAALIGLGTNAEQQEANSASNRSNFEAQQAAAAKTQARKAATGVFDVGHEAERDPRIMPTWSVMNRFNAEPADPSFDYMAQRDKLEAGMSDDEREYMRENANSEGSATRARAEIEYRRGLDQTYSDAGASAAFFGQMAAGLTDPAGLALGLGTVKAFQLARIGSGALAAAGRPAAAGASMLAENAAANMAVEGLSDAMGEVKTSADYAMAAGAGAILSTPFLRGVTRSANEAAVANHVRSIQERGVREQTAAATKVMTDEPHLTPEQVARRVEEIEADNISRSVSEATGPQRMDRVVPDDVRAEMVDDFTGVQPEQPKAAKETPDLDPEVLPEQPNIIEQLRKGEVTREVKDTSGAVIKLSWSPEAQKLKPHGDLGDTLTAIQSHPTASPVDKRIAKYLTKVMSDDGLALQIRFTNRDARSQFDPDGGVSINGVTSGIHSNPVDLTAQVHGLTKHGIYSVLHEVVHAATWHRINAWESAAGKLQTSQRKLLQQFQDLYDRFKETVDNGLPHADENHGAKYAAKNLHEFAAQIMTDSETRVVLSVMPGRPVAGRASTALREVMDLLRRVLGLDGRNGFHEAMRLVDGIIAMPVDNIHFKNGTPVFAPRAPKVTDTPEFKKWFGKSKAVTVGGEPRLMYHGTSKSPDGEGIHSFDTYGSNYGLFGQGSYFTDSANVASSYTTKGAKKSGGSSTVYPVYMKIEKPINMDGPAKPDAWAKAFPDVDFEGEYKPTSNTNEAYYRQVEEYARDAEMISYEAAEMIQDGLRSMGFDGITHIGGGRVQADGEKHRVFIAFDPEQIKSAIGNSTFDGGKPSIVESGADPKGANPIAAQRGRDSWAERMTQYAQSYIAKNPIDLARLKVITDKIGGISDGLALAGSKNPIMQLVASLVTETTTGAAGRQANVAIRSHMMHKKFMGNALIDYDNAYAVYRGRNGGGIIEDMWQGDIRRQFDQKVYEEVISRRQAGHAPHRDQSVTEAADGLEKLFDRAREGQVDAGVLGFANLPTTSKGYMPQALDGVKLQAATPEDLRLLHGALAEQFVARLGFDLKFAQAFAPFYTERVRRRSMGEKNIDGLGAGGDGLQLVRDTLDEMGADASLVDRARAASSKQGQGHTKARLDLDLLSSLRPGLRLMDFYVTNPMVLARSYAKRSAGTVALTEAGIHGIRGVRELRQASMFKQDAQPTKRELDAFDRVMAEILGTSVAGEVVSAGASNMSLLVTLQRLGGLVFTQAAETFNMIHHLGLRSVLGVTDLPRIMGEVGRLKRGEAAGNHLLTSIEAYGGEIGMDSYKLIAPLDAPDARLAQYMDQPGLLTRAMRAGGHLQSKISGFRGLMAAQHRMVAEQIVMKAARYIRDGKSDVALQDMGFSPEVAASLRSDLKHIAEWDANDRLVSFDLTRVSDARTAEAFVQAVHRGTSQIIQGTFVGERNAWFHNDYMRLLLQLRTFGLTATEKQWGRTRMNHGYTYAAGMLLGQMALALPIHAARVQLMSTGREDRDKYIKDNMKPAALVRATMNYSSLSGVTGDMLELLTQTAGGWASPGVKEALAVRAQGTSTRSLVPAVASADQLARVAGGKTDLHTALKQLPFSNLWYLVPAINLTKED